MIFLPPNLGYQINPVDAREVRLQDSFWLLRLQTNARVTLAHELDELEKTGRLDNFRVAAGEPGYKWSGLVFNDSDVYKVIEACADSIQQFPDKQIESRCDAIIDLIGRAQEADGYLHTPHEAAARGQKSPTSAVRWVSEDWDHELYCAGHMEEGAVAYFQATGKRKFLDIALKNADLVCRVFNSDHDRNVSGHEEIEIGLVKLLQVTGDRKYLNEARWLIDQRGRPDGRRKLMGPYAQDDRPVIEQQHAEGHSVRASYLYTAMADVNAYLHPPGYEAALKRFWYDVVSSQIYVTGGIGATGSNEGFTTGFDLPNTTAYCETCASVANALWNQRMFQTTGDSKYVDVAERTLYNAFLSGVGLDGKSFFYPNVLTSYRGAARSPWFECACCPPNAARLLPTFPSWIYCKSPSKLYLNYFVASTLKTKVNGRSVEVRQTTDCPFSGDDKISVSPDRPVTFDLAIRVPAWSSAAPMPGGLYSFADATPRSGRQAGTGRVEAGSMRLARRVSSDAPEQPRLRVTINSKDIEATPDASGYIVLHRTWRRGDSVEISLPMEAHSVVADNRVKDDEGRVAYQRGPLVYCGEGRDQAGSHLFDVITGAKPSLSTLGGPTLLVPAKVVERSADGTPQPSSTDLQLRLIPYAEWANHEKTGMTVWFASRPDRARPAPAPTLASTAVVTTSAGWGGEEMTDQIEAKSSIDHDHPYFHWWPRKGTHEWVELKLKKPSEVSQVRIYWFQDEGMGECRLPKNWQVMAKTPSGWTRVTAKSSYEIAKDRWCSVAFEPISTDAIRIEVDLPDHFSTGIHQIEVK